MTISSLERHNEAVRLKEGGLTYAEIGRHLGVTRERARQIVKGSRRRERRSSKVMLRGGEVALLLGVHINTVRRWNNKGLLRAYRVGSRGDRRFKRQDVESFLSEAMRKGAKDEL